MKEIYAPEVCATMQTQKNKNRYFDFVEVLLDPAPGAVEDAVRRHVHEDVSWHGFHPVNELNGRDAFDLPKTLLDLYDYDVFDNMRSIN